MWHLPLSVHFACACDLAFSGGYTARDAEGSTMGRRHFHFSPYVRGHLAEGACTVLPGASVNHAPDIWPPHAHRRHLQPPTWYEDPGTPVKRMFPQSREAVTEDPVPFTPTRRLYPWREECYTRGSTEDFCTMTSKRRSPPAPFQEKADRRQRRHFEQEDSFQQPVQEAKEAPPGKRHVQGPAGHMAGHAQVWRSEDAASGRRHSPNLGGLRPASAHVARRGDLPPQRRHLVSEDHLDASIPYSDQPSPNVCGERKARRARSHPPGYQGVAMAIRSQGAPPPPCFGSAGARARTPGRRRLEPQGQLSGGTVRRTSTPESTRLRRRLQEGHDKLLGGTLRYWNDPPQSPSFHSSRAPEDNLIGSMFRASSEPATPRPSIRCTDPEVLASRRDSWRSPAQVDCERFESVPPFPEGSPPAYPTDRKSVV